MNEEQKKKPTGKQWITIGAIALGVILAVVLITMNKGEGKRGDWATVIPGETKLSQNGEDPALPENSDTQQTDRETSGEEDSRGEATESPESLPGEQQSSETEGGETLQNNTDPIPTLGDEDPYEDWLASAMIIGISMQYGDYEFLGIYTASETPVAAHGSSKGAYVIFMGDGEKLALRATPLDGERADRGTMDLYVPAIGYATYELIDPETVPKDSLKERTFADLQDLIVASTQVSIIER